MAKTRVAINGFGRIGRLVLRAMTQYDSKGLFEIVALGRHNASIDQMAYLLKYDSVHRKYDADVSYNDTQLLVNGRALDVLKISGPEDMHWGDMGVDIVIEATGKYTTSEKSQQHLDAGAKKVMLTSPGKSDDIPTFVMGVNEGAYDKAKDHIISNASCTTNCLAPMAKVLDEAFGISKGLMTTVHAYTGDQRLHDGSHSNNFRARAACLSMVPTTTGAAKAVGKVLPQLKGKLTGFSLRVPTPTVSLVDLTFNATQSVTAEAVNEAMRRAAEGELKGILGYETDDCVSVDFTTDPRSCIFAPAQTLVVDDLVKAVAWYDNEWGYSCRCVDLVNHMIEQGL